MSALNSNSEPLDSLDAPQTKNANKILVKCSDLKIYNVDLNIFPSEMLRAIAKSPFADNKQVEILYDSSAFLEEYSKYLPPLQEYLGLPATEDEIIQKQGDLVIFDIAFLVYENDAIDSGESIEKKSNEDSDEDSEENIIKSFEFTFDFVFICKYKKKNYAFRNHMNTNKHCVLKLKNGKCKWNYMFHIKGRKSGYSSITTDKLISATPNQLKKITSISKLIKKFFIMSVKECDIGDWLKYQILSDQL